MSTYQLKLWNECNESQPQDLSFESALDYLVSAIGQMTEEEKVDAINKAKLKELGKDDDEVLRLCQVSGLVEVFGDAEFSKAWDSEIFYEDDFSMLVEEDIQ